MTGRKIPFTFVVVFALKNTKPRGDVDEAVSLVSSLPRVGVRTYHITYPSVLVAFVVSSRTRGRCSEAQRMTDASIWTFRSLIYFTGRYPEIEGSRHGRW